MSDQPEMSSPQRPLTQTDVGATPPQGVTIGAPRILMSTSMWLMWWSVAVDHVETAEDSRSRLVSARAGGTDWAQPLRQEMESSLQAVSGAAFACEALVIVWTDLVIDEATRDSWYKKGRRKSSGARRGEVFKRVLGSKVGAQADAAWEGTFELRDLAVHHVEQFAEPINHPCGVPGVSAVARKFTAEQARTAVAQLAHLTTAARDSQRSEIRAWLDERRHVLDLLEAGKRPR